MSPFSHEAFFFFFNVVVHEAHLRLGSPEGASGAFGAGPMTALTWKPGVLTLWTAALRQERWVMATPRHLASSWICFGPKEPGVATAGASIVLPEADRRSIPIVSHAGGAAASAHTPLSSTCRLLLHLGLASCPGGLLPRCGPSSPCAMHGYSGPRPWASFTTREAWLLLSLAPSPAQATLSDSARGALVGSCVGEQQGLDGLHPPVVGWPRLPV